jgi:predicted metalloprotease with PDZ domain
MFVPDSYDRERLARDWVLPHELSHLLLPFVRSEDAWLAEGLATYYQELTRARAGVITVSEALRNIAEALRSAQHEGTGRTLCEESRAMHQTHAYRAVYWGGAGALLMADLALRTESQGALTLDDLLTRIRGEARMAPAYSARELLARMDELAHSQLFRALAARCEESAFPDFEPALRALGVDTDGGVKEDDSGLQRAIFAPRGSPPP